MSLSRSYIVLLFASVLILLFIWLTRLVAIDRFPPFIDETIHVNGSELMLKGNLLPMVDLGRQLTYGWLMLFQPHLASPIWVARVATVLVMGLGVAAMMGIGRLLAGWRGALLAGLLYGLSNYHLFFGRLALADPVAAALILLAIYFGCRLVRRINSWDAVLVGIFLFLGVIAKVSVLPYLGIPLAAVVGAYRWGSHPRELVKWLVIASGVSLGLVLGFIGGLRLLKYDFLSNSFSYAVTNRGNQPLSNLINPERLFYNALSIVDLVGEYLGSFIVLLLILAVLYLLWKRQWYLPLCLFAPLILVVVSQVQETRFLFITVSLLLLCGAVVLARLMRNRLAMAVISMILILWAVFQWLPFFSAASGDPLDWDLPYWDNLQYVESDGAGFGLVSVLDVLEQQPLAEVIGILPNCNALRYLATNRLPVICPLLNPRGENIPELIALMDSKRGQGGYVVLQAVPYVPDSAPGTLIESIQPPGNVPPIHIYRLD